MIILHCIPEEVWESIRTLPQFGEDMIACDGFIHCSSVEYFWRVAPNFRSETRALLLLCIDTERLQSEVHWEDADGCGRAYPHIYGPINADAVTAVLPFLRNNNGEWRKNPELMRWPDK